MTTSTRTMKHDAKRVREVEQAERSDYFVVGVDGSPAIPCYYEC